MCSSTLATAAISMRGPTWTPGSVPGPTFRACTRSANFRANTSKIPSWTRMRLAQTQVWPVFRNLEASAPSTAWSTSASSKTMKAALPPSSSEIFLIVSALWRIRMRPTSVEPVKVILRTCRLSVNAPPISAAEPVTTLKTPRGYAGLVGQGRQGQGRERRLGRRFQDHRAARGEGGPRLAGHHRRREVPGRDGAAHPYRLLEDQDALVGLVRWDHVAIDPLGLLGEPLQERRAERDLGLRLGERFPLLRRHEPGQVVLIRQDQLIPAAQDRGALLRCLGPPRGHGLAGRLDGPAGLARPHLGHGADEGTRRGVEHPDRGAALRVAPLAVQVGPLTKQRGVLQLQRIVVGLH